MNYIHQLQRQIKEKNQEIEGLREAIQSLREYLYHPKFQGVSSAYVNPDDILLRIEEGLDETARKIEEADQ